MTPNSLQAEFQRNVSPRMKWKGSSLSVQLLHEDQTEEVVVKTLKVKANDIFCCITFKLTIFDIPLFPSQVFAFIRPSAHQGNTHKYKYVVGSEDLSVSKSNSEYVWLWQTLAYHTV